MATQEPQDKTKTSVARRQGMPTYPASGLLGLNPFSLMGRLMDDLNSFSGTGAESSQLWSPAIEVRERDGNLTVHAELPGLKPDDVSVSVEDDTLIIEGERKYEQETNEGGVRRTERRYGHFHRAIVLPQGADPDQAKAEFNNGVLDISIPVQKPEQNRKQIPVQERQ